MKCYFVIFLFFFFFFSSQYILKCRIENFPEWTSLALQNNVHGQSCTTNRWWLFCNYKKELYIKGKLCESVLHTQETLNGTKQHLVILAVLLSRSRGIIILTLNLAGWQEWGGGGLSFVLKLTRLSFSNSLNVGRVCWWVGGFPPVCKQDLILSQRSRQVFCLGFLNLQFYMEI